MKRIAILGSTGSIGQSALAVVDAHPDGFGVVALAAGGNAARLAEQVAEFGPRHDRDGHQRPRSREVRAATRAIVGAADSWHAGGDGPDRRRDASRRGRRALRLVGHRGARRGARGDRRRQDDRAREQRNPRDGRLGRHGGRPRAAASRVLPVDSEHNAIHQCLHGRDRREVARLILTASGGPFRGVPAAQLAGGDARRRAAASDLAHGAEDHDRLRDADEQGARGDRGALAVRRRAERIDVLVHPQSIVHSMVELVDGSVIAQLGVTDMRLPIQYAFSYPERWPAPLPPLDLARVRAARVRGAGHGSAFPASRWRSARSRAGGPADRAQRRERGRGRGVPRRRGSRSPASPRSSRRRWSAYERTAADRVAAWTMSGRSTAGRATSRPDRGR